MQNSSCALQYISDVQLVHILLKGEKQIEVAAMGQQGEPLSGPKRHAVKII